LPPGKMPDMSGKTNENVTLGSQLMLHFTFIGAEILNFQRF
jgi:hypothetical protein